MTCARARAVRLARCREAQATPRVARDVVYPEVVQAALTVPPAEKVHKPGLLIHAHRVSTAPARRVAVCVEPMELRPPRAGRTCMAVIGEEFCRGCSTDSLLGIGPVSLQYKAIIEFRHK